MHVEFCASIGIVLEAMSCFSNKEIGKFRCNPNFHQKYKSWENSRLPSPFYLVVANLGKSRSDAPQLTIFGISLSRSSTPSWFLMNSNSFSDQNLPPWEETIQISACCYKSDSSWEDLSVSTNRNSDKWQTSSFLWWSLWVCEQFSQHLQHYIWFPRVNSFQDLIKS